ncbi:MAG: phage antirepressor KilAC domain-containing protein [Leuconostoc pseudomesenteroides]|uniref:phage antirepressor KilAC domain-containing protein n=1 Tax=Leuconostoc pseudomesenteroides TaxID=33968 RepID=UPI0039EA611F
MAERVMKMNQLINVTMNENNEQVVSARDLYTALEVKKTYRFSQWFDTNTKQLIENEDFTSVDATTVVNNGAVKAIQDYSLTLDAAKQIAMMSGTEKGKEVRMYFIQIEKAWNSPEQIMARGLQVAQQQMLQYDKQIKELNTTIEEQKPKVEFAEQLEATDDSITVGTMAKIITQSGYKMGRNSLFTELRNSQLLISSGRDYNLPTQRAMNLGIFEVKTSTFGDKITHQTLVTVRGQQYLLGKIAKLLNEVA